MRVLVTGGSGFVGGRLVERLLACGHTVRILDSEMSASFPGISIVGDIRSYDVCAAAAKDQDAILHLAALYRDDVRPRSLYYEVNVEGTANVARAADANGVRHIIFTSSFSVYGLEDAGKSEEGVLSPVNDYGRSKLRAEELLLRWQRQQDANRLLQIVRPCVIFGEGNRGNVWTLVNQLANGRFLMIGSGANRKSMAYVGNIVEFLLLLLTRKKSGLETFNYADKPDMTVQEIVSLAANTLGRKKLRKAPLPIAAVMAIGYMGDMVGIVLGKAPTLNSERIRKFLADTSLPTQRVDATEFVRPFDLRDAFVRTVRHEFMTSNPAMPKASADHTSE